MKVAFPVSMIAIIFLTACNSSRVKEITVLSFPAIKSSQCIPETALSPDKIQGTKEIFFLVSLKRAKEIVFDSSAPYGYRAPHVNNMNLETSIWMRNKDVQVKYKERNDVKLRILLKPRKINGKNGVAIEMASSQVGGLSSYSYVDNILKTAHCLYTKIDLIKTVTITPELNGNKITLDQNTVIPVRITRTVSSRVSENNDNLEFIVLKNILINGILVISKGSRATGKVTGLEKSSILGGSGKVGISIDSVIATNGQKIDLVFSKFNNPDNKVGETIIMGLAATPLFFLKGDEASVSAGEEFDVKVSKKYSLHY